MVNMFSILIVVMISWAYTYFVQIHQDGYIKLRNILYMDSTSIKCPTKKKKKKKERIVRFSWQTSELEYKQNKKTLDEEIWALLYLWN